MIVFEMTDGSIAIADDNVDAVRMASIIGATRWRSVTEIPEVDQSLLRWTEEGPLDVVTPTQAELDAVAAEQARAQRNALLTASDWTQVADAPVDQSAWATYRQALRDIPQQGGFPNDVVWPEQPE